MSKDIQKERARCVALLLEEFARLRRAGQHDEAELIDQIAIRMEHPEDEGRFV